jgi:hypothetical protein
MTEGLKSRTLRVAGVNGALISPDIGVMSHIPSIVTCNALISLDIGVMSHIPSIVTCDALISLDIGVMSHIPSAVTCGFSIWTVAGSLVASRLLDENGWLAHSRAIVSNESISLAAIGDAKTRT